MDKEFSVTNSEFGDILSGSILDEHERENKALFGSIVRTERSFSIGTASQVPDGFFFPSNDSLFTDWTQHTNAAAANTDRLPTLPRISEIAELINVKKSDAGMVNMAETPIEQLLYSNLKREPQVTYHCSHKIISWPSVKLATSSLQYCAFKHTSNKTEKIKLQFADTFGNYNYFQFVHNNETMKELKTCVAAGVIFKFGILFLPLQTGEICSSIEVKSEDDTRIKLVDLFGFGGEAILRADLAFSAECQAPQIIFNSKRNSFKMTNYGDAILFYLFDGIQEYISVKPIKARILPMESLEILLNITNFKRINTIILETNETLVKIGEVSVIYGALSDILRIDRLYKDYKLSNSEIFCYHKELSLISKQLECVGRDSLHFNEYPENFNILYKNGLKCLQIDLMVVKSSFHDEPTTFH